MKLDGGVGYQDGRAILDLEQSGGRSIGSVHFDASRRHRPWVLRSRRCIFFFTFNHSTGFHWAYLLGFLGITYFSLFFLALSDLSQSELSID